MDRVNGRYEKLRTAHEKLLGETLSFVNNVLKSQKKDTDPDVVVKEFEGIKTALEGPRTRLMEWGMLQ